MTDEDDECCIIDKEMYCKRQDCKNCPWEFDLREISNRMKESEG